VSAARPVRPLAGLLAWAFYDWANSAFSTLIETFVFAAYFARSVAENETLGTAQWGEMLAVSGLVIGLGGPLLGAVADHRGRRKPWIGGFTLLAVVCTALLWFIKPGAAYVPAALVLVGLATVGMECGVIFANAMLPSICPPERLGRWSGWGWAVGYVGGLLCLVVGLYGLVTADPWLPLPRGEAEHVRATALLTALWFGLFSLPLFFLARDEPDTGMPLGRAMLAGLTQIRDSLRQARRYRDIGRFLLARMLYNDGLTTMFAFGGIYAAGTFGMGPEEILLYGIGLNVTAGLGAAAFAVLDDRLGPKKVIVWSLWGLMIPGTLMLVVTSKSLFWAFGLILGLFVGPAQASSRTWLARMAPEEVRNQMFGLFALSGKITAFIGPLLVGWLTLASGSQRVGLGAVILLFAAGLLLLRAVPPAAPGADFAKTSRAG
jgi:UMF1 family MFS transporter